MRIALHIMLDQRRIRFLQVAYSRIFGKSDSATEDERRRHAAEVNNQIESRFSVEVMEYWKSVFTRKDESVRPPLVLTSAK